MLHRLLLVSEAPAQQAPAQEAPAQVATEAPAQQAPAQQAPAQPVQQAPAQSDVYYKNCAEARAAGAAPPASWRAGLPSRP